MKTKTNKRDAAKTGGTRVTAGTAKRAQRETTLYLAGYNSVSGADFAAGQRWLDMIRDMKPSVGEELLLHEMMLRRRDMALKALEPSAKDLGVPALSLDISSHLPSHLHALLSLDTEMEAKGAYHRLCPIDAMRKLHFQFGIEHAARKKPA